ncbi:MAG: GspMb/PilO family protein [Planctomycetota bacterium]
MSFIKTHKKYLTIVGLIWAGCFILFLFSYIILLSPQLKHKKTVETKLAEVKQKHDSAVKATQEEAKIKTNEKINELRDRIKDFVITFEDAANLTFDISQVANEKKVGSFNIKMEENSKGTKDLGLKYLSENQIDIGFEGDFIQFATFLNALERHRPVVFVDNFKIMRSAMDDSNHRVLMKLSVFVRKQQES